MENFFQGMLAIIGLILLVVFLLPAIFSISIINWIGNYTDSAFVYTVLHLLIALPFMFIAFTFGPEIGGALAFIIGATGIFFFLIFLMNAHGLFIGEFDYSIYDNLSNWSPPAGWRP